MCVLRIKKIRDKHFSIHCKFRYFWHINKQVFWREQERVCWRCDQAGAYSGGGVGRDNSVVCGSNCGWVSRAEAILVSSSLHWGSVLLWGHILFPCLSHNTSQFADCAVCVCVRAHMHVHVHVRMHGNACLLCVCVCVRIMIYACMHKCMCLVMQVYWLGACARARVCVCERERFMICLQVCVCVCVCVCLRDRDRDREWLCMQCVSVWKCIVCWNVHDADQHIWFTCIYACSCMCSHTHTYAYMDVCRHTHAHTHTHTHPHTHTLYICVSVDMTHLHVSSYMPCGIYFVKPLLLKVIVAGLWPTTTSQIHKACWVWVSHG